VLWEQNVSLSYINDENLVAEFDFKIFLDYEKRKELVNFRANLCRRLGLSLYDQSAKKGELQPLVFWLFYGCFMAVFLSVSCYYMVVFWMFYGGKI